MKTLEYVKQNIDEFELDKFFGDRRFTKRFIDFLPTDEWEKFNFRYTGKEERIPKEWTEDNIIAQLKQDVKFGIEKAKNKRGISSNLMCEVVVGWCKVLENGLENIKYDNYGKNMFKVVDSYYNFGLIDKDIFDDQKNIQIEQVERTMEVSHEISGLYLAKCREVDRYKRLAADWMRKYLKEERKHWKWKRKYKYLNRFDNTQSAKLLT